MFDFKRCLDLKCRGVQPDGVDERNGIAARHKQRRRQGFETTLAQGFPVVQAASVVRGNPDCEAERFAETAQLSLHLGMGGFGLAQLNLPGKRGGLLAHLSQFLLPCSHIACLRLLRGSG